MNGPVPRRIVRFERDDAGEWVADLECGHRVHIRHDPPWQIRPWVLDDATRATKVGTAIECGRCATEGRR